MKPTQPSVLTINGGSSSIRFAVYENGEPLRRLLDGKVDRVGPSGTKLTFKDATGQTQDGPPIDSADPNAAVVFLLDWLEAQPVFASIKAAGHRVVHGMTHTEPERITPELLEELHRITPNDPEHLPLAIELMKALRKRQPAWPQVLARESEDVRAAEAVALFCYQAKKWIGSFAAALGGLDTLVFAGGIGENAPIIRTRICEGLGFLGVELNEVRNGENASLVSTEAARVVVRVIRADEELMIARSVIHYVEGLHDAAASAAHDKSSETEGTPASPHPHPR